MKRRLTDNLTPRAMARTHIAWIRTLREDVPNDPILRRLRDEKIEERIRLLRLALSDRRAEVSACLRGAA